MAVLGHLRKARNSVIGTVAAECDRNPRPISSPEEGQQHGRKNRGDRQYAEQPAARNEYFSGDQQQAHEQQQSGPKERIHGRTEG